MNAGAREAERAIPAEGTTGRTLGTPRFNVGSRRR
jgi:hypothetical protein